MASSAKLILRGDKATIRKLKRLGDRQKMKKVLRRATSASAQVVVKAVRQIWKSEANETGLSARSIKKKVIKTKGGYIGIVGVDRNATGTKENGKKHVPAKIDHLVELGYQLENGQTIPAVAPLRRGFEASKHAADAEYIRKANEDIKKEAAKR